jgi:predicted kinase
MLVIFRGLPGSGKTHLVRRLVARSPGLLVLSRDVLRADIVPRPDFSAGEKDLIDSLIVAMAGFLVDRDRDVVIDGMALSSARRVGELVAAAGERGFRIVECVCSEKTALARIGGDRGSHLAGDRGEALYREVKARWETVPYPALTVDTETDTEAGLALIMDWIRRTG